jgi:hypothetical protein
MDMLFADVLNIICLFLLGVYKTIYKQTHIHNIHINKTQQTLHAITPETLRTSGAP